MPPTKADVSKLMKQLEAALAKEFEQTQAIAREGDRIVIPEAMSYDDAARAILSHKQKMDEEVQTMVEFDAHPNDGLVAFYRAVRASFGALMGASVETFFGTIPGKSLNVPIGPGETMNVPIGRTEVPGIPISMDVRPNYDENSEVGGSLVVIFRHMRKYEPMVRRIEAAARAELAEHSIFTGKAIDSQFAFLDLSRFKPERVVYARREERQIKANILAPIAHTAQWIANGSSCKRGVLLSGQYGTGKTLTALLTAWTAVKNGWTFINVLPRDSIVRSLKFAQRYQPAVVFFEDIDADTSGPTRDDRVNEILNSVDGVLAKDSKVMVVLTTNHIERVNRAMLRPGRLDSIIELGALDVDGAVRLINMAVRDQFGDSALTGELNVKEIERAAAGYVPAYIVEAVTKAKAYAMAESEDGGPVRVTSEHIVDALDELRPQFELMQSEAEEKPRGTDEALKELVNGVVTTVVEEQLDGIKDQIQYLYDAH